jgi:hypothetical protein
MRKRLLARRVEGWRKILRSRPWPRSGAMKSTGSPGVSASLTAQTRSTIQAMITIVSDLRAVGLSIDPKLSKNLG